MNVIMTRSVGGLQHRLLLGVLRAAAGLRAYLCLPPVRVLLEQVSPSLPPENSSLRFGAVSRKSNLTSNSMPSRKPVEKTLIQKLALAYWSFHYTKRILETFFVHR